MSQENEKKETTVEATSQELAQTQGGLAALKSLRGSVLGAYQGCDDADSPATLRLDTLKRIRGSQLAAYQGCDDAPPQALLGDALVTLIGR
jgi:hypothetical protein